MPPPRKLGPCLAPGAAPPPAAVTSRNPDSGCASTGVREQRGSQKSRALRRRDSTPTHPGLGITVPHPANTPSPRRALTLGRKSGQRRWRCLGGTEPPRPTAAFPLPALAPLVLASAPHKVAPGKAEPLFGSRDRNLSQNCLSQSWLTHWVSGGAGSRTPALPSGSLCLSCSPPGSAWGSVQGWDWKPVLRVTRPEM